MHAAQLLTMPQRFIGLNNLQLLNRHQWSDTNSLLVTWYSMLVCVPPCVFIMLKYISQAMAKIFLFSRTRNGCARFYIKLTRMPKNGYKTTLAQHT
jgi:hypothetical protein